MTGKRIFFLALLGTVVLFIGRQRALATPPVSPPLAARTEGGTVASTPLGTSFTYQGYLESDGSPVNDTCDLQFKLWDALNGGAQVGQIQTSTNVAVNGGQFTVQLDFGSAFYGDARWLEIALRCPAGNGNYTTLTPRQALTAAPYAQGLLPGATIVNKDPSAFATLYLRTDSGAGLLVDSGGSGVRVGQAGGDGVGVGIAGLPTAADYSSENDGFEIGGAQGNGLYVGRADANGVQVNSAGNNGLQIGTTTYDGVQVQTAGRDGIRILQADSNGIQVNSTGNNGLQIGTTTYDGVQVQTAGRDGIRVVSAGGWAGNFNGNISVTGSCTGCRLATFGVNTSNEMLSPGDVVSVQGIQSSSFDGVPMLVDVAPAKSGEAIVGVVYGRAEPRTAENLLSGVPGEQLIPQDGAARPGGYVTIVIYGPVQVRVNASGGPVATGARLTVAEAGRVRAAQSVVVDGVQLTESVPTLGIALEDQAADGLVWVLVNPH